LALIRNMIDIFDSHFPGGALLIDYLRRARIDLRSIIRTLKPWYERESNIPLLTVEVANICNSNGRFCDYQYQGRFRNFHLISIKIICFQHINKSCLGNNIIFSSFYATWA
jgi:hypothetical protein